MSAVPRPPTGWRRLAWLGPGFLWMVSAAGSGELLFSPRVGALYGYAFLWAMLAAVAMKWLINREIGRFALCQGGGLLAAFARMPGRPRGWAAWLILAPQVVVALATIAGLASGAATALALVFPGPHWVWVVLTVASATALVLWGRFKGIERVATVIALALGVAAIVAATLVRPPPAELARGLAPSWPEGAQGGELLPWLGFMLAGAAGMVWYSYWVRAKGYGLGREHDAPPTSSLGPEDLRRLRGWIRQMTLDNTVAVVGTVVVATAFLTLGAQVLRPAGLVPAEEEMAATLGRMLGDLWGPIGFWFMVLGVFVGFWDTVLSDQDGFGRMFADGTRSLAGRRLRGRWARERWLRGAFVLVLTALLPLGLYAVIGEPVTLLKIAGAIEAAHIPVVAWLTLRLNLTTLPDELRPRRATVVATAGAGLFFALFALYYLGTLVGAPWR